MSALLRIFRSFPETALLVGALAFYGIGRMIFDTMAGPDFAFEWEATRLAPMALAGAAAYSYLHRKTKHGLWVDLLFASIPVIYLLYFDPVHYVDDAGFILRYLDNMDKCFYCFNPEDGAVFGISSFLYGFLSGLLVSIGLVGPEACLLLLACLGAFLSAYYVLRILRHVLQRPELVFMMAFIVFFGARTWLNAANSGMEASFHYAICLGAIWYFLIDNRRAMWFFFALAIFSKLDAVPIVGVLGLLFLIRSKSEWRDREYWMEAGIFFGLPLLGYFALTLLLFGSVFPQSAYAKLFHHAHGDGFFPFWEHFMTYPLSSIYFFLFCLTFAFQALVVSRGRTYFQRSATPGLALLGVLALYFFYNPAERMIWYYVLPEGLMLLQTVLSFGAMINVYHLRASRILLIIVFGGFVMFSTTQTLVEMRAFRLDLEIVDGERDRLGKWLAEKSNENDRVLAAHGLTSRHLKGYVMDASGLNWKPAIDYGGDHGAMIRDEKPDWIIDHGWDDVIAAANEGNYSLEKRAYDIATLDGIPWYVYKKVLRGDRIERIEAERVLGPELEVLNLKDYIRVMASFVELRLSHGQDKGQLIMGVSRRDTSFQLVLDEMQGPKLRKRSTMDIPAHIEHEDWTFPITFPLSPADSTGKTERLRIYWKDKARAVDVIDPAILFKGR